MKLVGYIRVSRMKDGGISPELQREAIVAYAKAHGHDVRFLEPDLDESGSKLDRRSLQKALALVREGKADGIIAARLDRLTRSVTDLGRLLEEAKGDRQEGKRPWNLIAVDMGLDASTDNGKLVWNMLASIAEWELDRRRTGWADARQHAIDRGVHIGIAPAGYRKAEDGSLVPNEHAEAVRRAFELRAAGASWPQVAAHLTDAGVRTCWEGRERKGKRMNGKAWGLRSAATVLANDVYLGIIRSGEFVNEEAHEPIVSRALFKAVEDRKQTRAVALVGHEPRLLSGLLYCASCGGRMSTDWRPRPNGSRYYFYRCRNAGKGRCPARPSCSAAKIEMALEEVLREWLSAERFQITLAGVSNVTDLKQELKLAQAEYEEWILNAPEGISNETWSKRAAVLEKRVADKQEKLDTAEAAGLSASRIPSIEVYEQLPIAARREVMAAWLDAKGLRLRVLPGRGPNRYQLVPTNDAGYTALAELYGEGVAEKMAALAR